MNIIEQSDLYYKDGSSNKEYHTQLVKESDGFKVNFQYGRVGNTLQTGTKTPKSLSEDKAKKIFDKLIQEKTAKGYTSGKEGKPYVGTTNEKKISGLNVQLLNPISEEECESLLKDDEWGAQEKFDGKRMLLKKESNKITAINRKGLECGFPSEVEEQLLKIKDDFIIDGEMIGTTYHIFDILSFDIVGLQTLPYNMRYQTLLSNFKDWNNKITPIADFATTTKEKQKLYKSLKNKEGIVFKKLNAPYTSGRPNSGGSQLKYKFYSNASCIVTKINDKNSISLGLYDGDKLIDVGNATLYSNKEIPKESDIVEIRYLNIVKGGSLYQPVYIGIRDDLNRKDCNISQLKYKNQDG